MSKQYHTFHFTSESVTEGHPDKICDRISDAILDAYLQKDSYSRCAIECIVTKNQLVIAGEISSKIKINHEEIARNVILEIGYIDPLLGFHTGCDILDLIHIQAPELNKNEGAGDQGFVFGYACNQTKELMPLPIVLAHKLTHRLSEVRKENIIEGLYPDGKSQVTVRYENNMPVSIDNIIVSAHHSNRYKDENEFVILKSKIINHVVYHAIPQELIPDKAFITINPNGQWYKSGGPAADTGVTGRKIIADTYGGFARHGGGAFSGKDATKVDRSGAYMARKLAKSIVRKRYANECEIQLGFAIGKTKPISRAVKTFGTENVSIEKIQQYLFENSDITISQMVDSLNLREPRFQELTNYGHFGRDEFIWS